MSAVRSGRWSTWRPGSTGGVGRPWSSRLGPRGPWRAWCVRQACRANAWGSTATGRSKPLSGWPGVRGHRPELVQSFLFHANVAVRLAAPWRSVRGSSAGFASRSVGSMAPRPRSADRALASGSVCVSRGVLEFSRDTGGLDPRRLIVIPNGIDPEPFDRSLPVPRGDRSPRECPTGPGCRPARRSEGDPRPAGRGRAGDRGRPVLASGGGG